MDLFATVFFPTPNQGKIIKKGRCLGLLLPCKFTRAKLHWVKRGWTNPDAWWLLFGCPLVICQILAQSSGQWTTCTNIFLNPEKNNMPPLLESKDPNWFFRGDIVLEMFKWGLLKEKTRPFFHKEIFANPQLPTWGIRSTQNPFTWKWFWSCFAKVLNYCLLAWQFGQQAVIRDYRDYLMIFWGGSFHITIFQGTLIYGFCQGWDLWQIWNSAQPGRYIMLIWW